VIDDRSGALVASAEIRAGEKAASSLAADLESDANGRFEAPDLPSGDYVLEISKPNYIATKITIRVKEGVPEPVVVRLVHCGAVSGHVTDEQGRGVRSATVFAMSRSSEKAPFRPVDRSGAGYRATVDQDGAYRLYNLRPGQYAVAVTYGASSAMVSASGDTHAGAEGSGILYYPPHAQPRIFTVTSGDEYNNVDFVVVPGALYRVSGRLEEVRAKSAASIIALTDVAQPGLATAVTQAAEAWAPSRVGPTATVH
jgi:hypothetical protein